ncbi:MAG: hypothetical protein LC655_08075, partial [Bacteroidales bacterium]|nr:hypothetical protein [Bacteroidales bacterium]
KDEIGEVNSYRVTSGSGSMDKSNIMDGSETMNGSGIMNGSDMMDGSDTMNSSDIMNRSGSMNGSNMMDESDTMNGAGIIEGKLKIGSTMQTMLIRALKKSVHPGNTLTIYDAPPGTSCPVVETIVDTDYVVLVTEPTPFGLHDLRLMVSIVKEIGKPYGVVINKAGLGDDEIYTYLDEQGAAILGEIPYSRDFASGYASGSLLTAVPVPVRDQLKRIAETILTKLKA